MLLQRISRIFIPPQSTQTYARTSTSSEADALQYSSQKVHTIHIRMFRGTFVEFALRPLLMHSIVTYVATSAQQTHVAPHSLTHTYEF